MSASGEARRQRARDVADNAATYESPDGRSVPYLLMGILNALLAIEDRLDDIAERESR